MDYFVNIDNCLYHQWQIELLIESFKKLGLEKNLHVAINETKQGMKSDFCRNLFAHKRLTCHEDIGHIRGYDKLNKLYALDYAVREGKIKQPFAVLEPDMLLYREPKITQDKFSRIVFQVSSVAGYDEAISYIPNLQSHLTAPKTKWVPVGSFMYFDNIPQDFFRRTIQLAELFAYEQFKSGKSVWKNTDKVAWTANIMDAIGRANIEGRNDLEMPLIDHENTCPLINYEHGLPPDWSKNMFLYKGAACISMGDPFEKLKEVAVTSVSKYAAEIADLCLKARNELAPIL